MATSSLQLGLFLFSNYPILAGIQPAELCHKEATLTLACHSMEPRHLLHSALTCPMRRQCF